MKKLILTIFALLALTLTGCLEDSQMGKVGTDQQ